MRTIPTTAILAAIFGTLLFVVSLSIPVFRDGALFATEYSKLGDEVRSLPSGSSTRAVSEKYWALREAQLTYRYTIQDYALCCLVFSAFLGALTMVVQIKSWTDIKTLSVPAQRWPIILLAGVCGFSVPTAYVVDLLQEYERNAFPHWADSMGIPLMSVPLLLIASMAIAGFFLLALLPGYKLGVRVSQSFTRGARPPVGWLVFLGLPMIGMAVLAVVSFACGSPIAFATSMLWFVFFVLCFAGRQQIPIISECDKD
jgi:hypothetical protein